MRHWTCRKLPILALIATQSTFLLCAQTPVDLATIDLEDLLKIRVETVFGASKFLQKVTEAPAAISIVTGSEIRAYGYRTIGDILRRVGGFNVNYDRNYSYVGVRGFQRPGDYNSRILMLVDNHRINENIYDMTFVGTEFPIDIEMIERMEVIRGPSSSIYGTNAFLAVINIITKKGSAIDGLRVSTDVGSLGTRKVLMSFGKGLDNGLDLQLSASTYASDGQRNLYFPEFDTPVTNNGIARDLDKDSVDRFMAAASFKGFTFQGVYGSREKKVPTAAFGAAFNDPNFKTRDARGYADLRYERTLGNGVYLTGRVYYDAYGYDGFYPSDESTTDVPEIRIFQDYAHGKWWGAEVGVERKIFQKHRVTVGSEYRDNFSQKQGGFYVSPFERVFEDNRQSQVWAGYVEDEFSISKSLILNMGVRHDRYEMFGGTTNPRAGLIYSPADQTALKFLWGTAFRAPNAYEMFYNNSLIQGNASLRPETVDTREIAFEKYIADRYRFSVNAFQSRTRNLIDLDVDSDGLWRYVNVHAADTKGLGFEFEARWRSGIGVRGVYSFQQAKDKATGNELAHAVPHLASGNLLIPVVPRKVLAGLDLHYVGPANTIAGNHTDAFVVPSLTFSTPSLRGGLDFSASIYNLFNAKHGHPGNEEHLQNVISQDGRTVRVQIGFTWGNDN